MSKPTRATSIAPCPPPSSAWVPRPSSTHTQRRLDQALSFKNRGNASFVSHPPNHQSAIASYTAALACLPTVPPPPTTPPTNGVTGLEEVGEEEAAAIQAFEEERKRLEADPEAKERLRLEEQVSEMAKACWGNLGACHAALVSRRPSDPSAMHVARDSDHLGPIA